MTLSLFYIDFFLLNVVLVADLFLQPGNFVKQNNHMKQTVSSIWDEAKWSVSELLVVPLECHWALP